MRLGSLTVMSMIGETTIPEGGRRGEGGGSEEGREEKEGKRGGRRRKGRGECPLLRGPTALYYLPLLTRYCTDKEHPSPAQHLLDAIANGKG